MAKHFVSPALLTKLDQAFPDRITMIGILPESSPGDVVARVNQRIGARKVIEYLRSLNENEDDNETED